MLSSPHEILAAIQKKGIEQAEVYLSSSKSLKIDVLNQKVESMDEIEDTGLGIRIIKDKKLGFAFTAFFAESLVEHTIEQAIENAKYAAEDENWEVPENRLKTTDQRLKTEDLRPKTEIFDPEIERIHVDKKIELALKIEEAAYHYDKRVKKTEKISYSDAESFVQIVNSNGLDATYKSNHCGALAMVIACSDGQMEAGTGMQYVKTLAELKVEEIGQEAAQKAVELLNSKNIKSQKLPIILDPVSASELLEVLAGPFSAEAVQKGKSLFAHKMDQRVAAPNLKIIDDGTLEHRIGSAPFDDEGTPTQKTLLIDNGILRNFLHNTYTAKKGNARSTGNAVRGGYRSLPVIGPTNLYVEPGKTSLVEMIKSVNHGLFIRNLMGIHTINPISGDFSIGAAGIMVEKGALTYPVRGITIAGNVIAMLEAVEEVGSDLRFIANIGSPSLSIGNISVSGD